MRIKHKNTCSKNKNKARNVTKMLQILQLYYILEKHLQFTKIIYIMSAENNKKIFQQKRNILQKFTYNIIKGGTKKMKLTKKQKKQIKQKLDKMFFEFLGCLAVSAVFVLFMIYALEH